MEKKRRLISMDKLPIEIHTEFQKRYPNGYRRYIQKITNHKREVLYCVPVETDDSLWMIKVKFNNNGGLEKPVIPELDEDDDENEVMDTDDGDIPIPDSEE
ncbi:MAG: hypothetical protein WD048_16325 [Chitinophagales bacterium]